MPHRDSPMARERKIRCPKCDYKPQPEDRWACVPRCATFWHTFWTAGVCPGCGLQWPLTQCPHCGQISPHRQWYLEPEPEAEPERKEVLEPEEYDVAIATAGEST
jgi:hypothetical protein